MRATRILLKHTPSIRFLGKRSLPKEIDHTPRAHPSSPTHSLPDSFKSYRSNAQQYGPMGSSSSGSSSAKASSAPPPPPSSSSSLKGSGGLRSDRSGKSLGSVQAKEGEYFDRSELPVRFRKTPWVAAEIDAVESGGASKWGW